MSLYAYLGTEGDVLLAFDEDGDTYTPMENLTVATALVQAARAVQERALRVARNEQEERERVEKAMDSFSVGDPPKTVH